MGVITQDPTNIHQAMGKRIFGHHHIGPNGGKNLILADQQAGMKNQILEDFKRLGPQRGVCARLKECASRNYRENIMKGLKIGALGAGGGRGYRLAGIPRTPLRKVFWEGTEEE